MSITSRMMLYLMSFVAIVLALLWLFQIAWLDDFYRYYKTRQIESAAVAIAQDACSDSLSDTVEAIAGESDICVLLVDENHSTVASGEGVRACLIHRLSTTELSWLCSLADESDGPITALVPSNRRLWFQFMGNQAAESTQAPKGGENLQTGGPEAVGRFGLMEEEQSQSLVFIQKISLGEDACGYLLLNTLISPISATVSTLRAQLTIITVGTVLLALLVGFLIARQLSQPIIATNEAAHGLSRARYERPKHSGSYREISELNDTLEKAAEDLGQVENLQHELIANISHDLRTPLTMIGGYAEAMRDIPGESTPENMQIIIDETARLSTLVNELLDFSRMQTGSAPMNIAPFCLTETVSAIVTRVGQMVSKDGYTVRFSPDFTCEAQADENRISQVVYNLIGNALTYTGEDRQVLVTQTRRGANVRISVTDTGKGIAADELPLIWNRYYRTKETHKRAIIGSGLGLNIVQTILEQHGVPYGVDSEEGRGSTFWFELPEIK